MSRKSGGGGDVQTLWADGGAEGSGEREGDSSAGGAGGAGAGGGLAAAALKACGGSGRKFSIAGRKAAAASAAPAPARARASSVSASPSGSLALVRRSTMAVLPKRGASGLRASASSSAAGRWGSRCRLLRPANWPGGAEALARRSGRRLKALRARWRRYYAHM